MPKGLGENTRIHNPGPTRIGGSSLASQKPDEADGESGDGDTTRIRFPKDSLAYTTYESVKGAAVRLGYGLRGFCLSLVLCSYN